MSEVCLSSAIGGMLVVETATPPDVISGGVYYLEDVLQPQACL
jgi:hypothetical protein